MRLFLRTFGCRANQYDSEQVRALAVAAGAVIVDDPSNADVAVFNSCAVTAEAERDLRKGVRRAARQRPELRTIVMGCAAAVPTAAAIAALPTVDAVIPGADLEAVARAQDLPLTGVAARQSDTRALLRIQDGCDEHCTFCATRVARGRSRSRPVSALVDEARALAEHHAEIVLTGVHIGGYATEECPTLGLLVERLVNAVPVARFRLSSVEATEIDDRLRAHLRERPDRVTPYVHAPLQSGSDRVLKRMGRNWYAAASYAAAIERLTHGLETFGLGADIISGFPGETEEDHRATVRLVESLPFTGLHVFPYSARPGTAASRVDEPVPEGAAAERAAELRALGAAKADAYRRRRIGGRADVIALGGGRGRTGLTGDYLPVMIEDPAIPRGTRFPATLIERGGRLSAVPVAA